MYVLTMTIDHHYWEYDCYYARKCFFVKIHTLIKFSSTLDLLKTLVRRLDTYQKSIRIGGIREELALNGYLQLAIQKGIGSSIETYPRMDIIIIFMRLGKVPGLQIKLEGLSINRWYDLR